MNGPREPTSKHQTSLAIGETMRLIREDDVDSVVELIFSDGTRVRFMLHGGGVASVVRGQASFDVYLHPASEGVVPKPSLNLIPGGKS